jgi:hypothetical protein
MKLEDAFDGFADCIEQTEPFVHYTNDLFQPSPPMGLDPFMAYSNLDRDFNLFNNPLPIEQLVLPFASGSSIASWEYSSNEAFDDFIVLDSRAANRVPSTSFLIDAANIALPFESPRPSDDSDGLSPGASYLMDGPQYLGCSCYKQAIVEFLRPSIKADSRGISSIDNILACQKNLLLQTEAILQCQLCSQSEAQPNLLMVVVVTIDSLLTSLDAATTSSNAGNEDGVPAMGIDDGHRAHIDVVGGFRSHIDACPLSVGGFRVPTDEKMCFVRQMLHGRLSKLMIMIRRIRVCMQQHLASALSRGRLLMIMETDRRLQLIMMKVKMAVG